jgi:uncharacterized protein (DUF58 family)
MSELADRPLRVTNESIWLHWWRLLRWFANLRLVPSWREIDSRLILRALRRYYYDGLTRSGKVLFIGSLLTFLFSYRTNSDLYMATAALGFSLLAWGALLGYVYRPRVTASRRAPLSCHAGENLASTITLQNHKARSLNNFTVRELVIPYAGWPREWHRLHLPSLAPGQSHSLAVGFTPRRRGKYDLSGIAVQSYFPFFLTRFTQRLPLPAEVYVLPEALKSPIPSLRKVAEQASKKLQLGSDNSRKGPSLEYGYSRPYQTGDSLRRLDHRAGSRLGQPMSKVFEGVEEVRRDQVYLIVDLSLADFLRWQRRPVDDSPLDQRLALAVEIGLSASNEGFNLVALATGADWHSLENPQSFDQLIARCQAEKTPDQAMQDHARNLPDSLPNEEGLYVLVLGRWSDEARQKVELWRKAGILVLVFLLAERDADRDSLPAGDQFIEIQQAADSGKKRSWF